MTAAIPQIQINITSDHLTSLVDGFVLTCRVEGKSPNTVTFYKRILDKTNDTKNAEKYEIMHEDYVEETLTHKKLIGTLEGNLDIACQKYSQWEVFDCLMPHVEAEYPEDIGLHNLLLEGRPLEYIGILRTLAQRKMFIGTCPVCKDW